MGKELANVDSPASTRPDPVREAEPVSPHVPVPVDVPSPPPLRADDAKTTGRMSLPPVRAEAMPSSSEGLLRRVEETSPRVIDHRASSRMAAMLEFPLPSVRVVEGPAADELARRQGADALSVGDTIVMRRGMFQTERPEGLALLAHELTHADARRRVGGNHADADPAAVRAEEIAARAGEARIYRELTAHARSESVPAVSPTPLPARIQAPRSVIPGTRAAASDRPREPAREGGPAPARSISADELRAIKDEVYRDLLTRLRTEFERGG